MEHNSDKNIDQLSAQRIKEFLNFLELTPIGLAAFLEISTDHTYSLLKGRRSISDSIAYTLSEKLGINSADVYNTNFKLRKTKLSSEFLKNFISSNKNSSKYFENQKVKTSLTLTIRVKLLEEGFFKKERRSNEVVDQLKKIGFFVNSEKATKSLKYLENTGYLTSAKKRIITKDGILGVRLVNYYMET